MPKRRSDFPPGPPAGFNEEVASTSPPSASGPRPPARPDPRRNLPSGPGSALPPLGARILAFASVLVAGIFGGLIGYAVVDIATEGDRPILSGLVGLASAVVAAIGVAIVAVLTMRAMGEWKTNSAGRRRTAR